MSNYFKSTKLFFSPFPDSFVRVGREANGWIDRHFKITYSHDWYRLSSSTVGHNFVESRNGAAGTRIGRHESSCHAFVQSTNNLTTFFFSPFLQNSTTIIINRWAANFVSDKYRYTWTHGTLLQHLLIRVCVILTVLKSWKLLKN